MSHSVPLLPAPSLLLLVSPPPPLSTLFPYTTLFRSAHRPDRCRGGVRRRRGLHAAPQSRYGAWTRRRVRAQRPTAPTRSEEHTSELQSLRHLVCRLLLEKKKYQAIVS